MGHDTVRHTQQDTQQGCAGTVSGASVRNYPVRSYPVRNYVPHR